MVFVGLFLFGIGYNILVSWMEKKGFEEGFTAILVVFEVAITGCGVATICWNAAILVLEAFTASGTLMVIGSSWRYVHRRIETISKSLAEIWGEHNDDKTATLAEQCPKCARQSG
jgi:hypothetical protein